MAQALWTFLASLRESAAVPEAVARSDVYYWYAVTSVLIIVAYPVLCLPYFVLEMLRLPATERWRIQPAKARPRMKVFADMAEAVVIIAVTSVAFTLPIALLLERLGDGLVDVSDTLPSPLNMVLHVAFYQFVEDLTLYWSHRALHTYPSLYAYHKKHHTSTAPWAGVAIIASIPEVLLGNYVPTFAGPLLLMISCRRWPGLRPHLVCTHLWLLLRLTYTFHVHSGYNFPWSPERVLGSVYAGPLHHDEHHRLSTGNFSSTLTWLDVVFKTRVEDYEERRKSKAE